MFNEQYNGDRQTDYASALRQVTPAAVQAPSITTTALTGGATDDAYSQTLAATGTAPIIWTITSGSLPDGLALSGDTISGTPTAAGTFTFVVQAANAAGSDSRELSIVIHSAPVINLPATGDSSQMGLWIGLAMLSFAGLATCAALWRRKRIS